MSKSALPITANDIFDAAVRIKGAVNRTPTNYSQILSRYYWRRCLPEI